MEASALQAPTALARSRLSIGSPLLRLRSDEQLVALFRGGNEEAFRVIHDRYRQRLFAYTRQMLPGSRQDAEDALQDIFVRAYAGLRASDRQLALRAWLYRVAHNRCVDELRRPAPPSAELMEIVRPPVHDPIAEAERRESLRQLIEDLRRLPEQQRSALLMRELGGMTYADLAAALRVSVPAIKSLLVRARVGLVQATEARDMACGEIRLELSVAHDRGVRPSGIARRHMHDCASCREFRGQVRGASRRFAALVPVGPLGLLANLFGFGGGGAAGGSAAGGGAAGGSAAAAGGVAGTTGAVASIGAVAGGAASHVATIIAAAVVTAGGAVEIQRSVSSAPRHPAHRLTLGGAGGSASAPSASTTEGSGPSGAAGAGSPRASARAAALQAAANPAIAAAAAAAAAAGSVGPTIPAVDQLNPADLAAGSTTPGPTTATSGTSGTSVGTSSGPSTGTPTGTGQASAGSPSGSGAGASTAGPSVSGSGPGGGSSASGTGVVGAGAGGPGSGTGASAPETSRPGSSPGGGPGGSAGGATPASAGAAQPSSSSNTPVALPATARSGAKTVRAVEKRVLRLGSRSLGHHPRHRGH